MALGAGGMNTQALWYFTRGTGTVSLLLLTAVMVLGVVNSVRWSAPDWPRFAIQRVHRNLSLLVVGFIVLHVAAAVIDGYVSIRWVDAILPFGSAYRPVWLGLGAVAFDLVVALIATSLLRTRLGYRAWRVVHWTAYVCWPVALVHGIGAGSDRGQVWMLALDAVSLVAFLGAVWWRVTAGTRPRTMRPEPLPALSGRAS
jgi:sulfoxide reductase heme-binding subunit YedZ